MKHFVGTVKSGEVWLTESRKGTLVIKFLENVNFKEDTFFKAEIVEGTAKFLSGANNLDQKLYGHGAPGSKLEFRTGLIDLVRKV